MSTQTVCWIILNFPKWLILYVIKSKQILLSFGNIFFTIWWVLINAKQFLIATRGTVLASAQQLLIQSAHNCSISNQWWKAWNLCCLVDYDFVHYWVLVGPEINLVRTGPKTRSNKKAYDYRGPKEPKEAQIEGLWDLIKGLSSPSLSFPLVTTLTMTTT
jgi:hypothetical protein